MHSLLRRHLIGWLVGPGLKPVLQLKRRGGTSQSVLDITVGELVGGDVVLVLLATL
jgi:hypothetical protein